MKKKERSSRRLIATGLVVVVLAAGGWWALEAFTGEVGNWVEVERGDLTLGVEVTGKLAAVETDLVGPPKLQEMWQYKIAFMAPEGATVAEGDRVLGFDSSELNQRLQQEIAERDAARKRVEKAEKEGDAAREHDELALAVAEAKMRKAGLRVERPDVIVAEREQALDRLELELAEKEVTYLKARLASSLRATEAYLAMLRSQQAQAEQEVAETEDSIGQMMQPAPRGGTVVYVTNWREEKKAVGDTAWRGEDVIELPDLSRMKANGQVHEADAGRLAEGQTVKLRLDAHPDVEFRGKVARIWSTVQRESWSSPLKVVRVDIELDETDTRKMRPGMRFRGKVEIERVEEALLLAVDSVFLEADGPVVYRRTWRGHEPVRVVLGRRDDDEVEVLEGLREGDLVSVVALGGEGGET